MSARPYAPAPLRNGDVVLNHAVGGGDTDEDETAAHGPVLAMVDIAAAVGVRVSGGGGGSDTAKAKVAASKAALAALAADLGSIPGVASVVHTRVAPEAELRSTGSSGRRQAFVKGGRGGGRGGGGRGGGGGGGGGRGGGGRGGGRAVWGSNEGASGGGVNHNANEFDGNGGGGGGGGGGGQVVALHGASTLPMTLRGITFALSAPSFFQTNTAQAEQLAEAVEVACGFSGDNTEVVLDLFCGVGTLGLCVAAKAKHVYGWEVVQAAVDDAKTNAAANGITNATFRQGDLAKLKASLGAKGLSLGGARGKGETADKEPPDLPHPAGPSLSYVFFARTLSR